jgi:hypothetical protein
LAKLDEEVKRAIVGAAPSLTLHPSNDSSMQSASMPPATMVPAPVTTDAEKIGDYVPFKQSRLQGQTNPLRPPHHVETVLIGRALGQHTGYLFGVGYRVRDDGYLEAEFADGIRKFDTYETFKTEVTNRVGRGEPA